MVNVAVGDGVFILSRFRKLFYQKQIIQGCSPAQGLHSYQLYIYDALHLSKMNHIYAYNGEFRPAPGQKRLMVVMIYLFSYGEKTIFTHNFFVSTRINTLPMTKLFVLASLTLITFMPLSSSTLKIYDT